MKTEDVQQRSIVYSSRNVEESKHEAALSQIDMQESLQTKEYIELEKPTM